MNKDQERLLTSLSDLFNRYSIRDWQSVARLIGLPVKENGLVEFKRLVIAAIKNIEKERLIKQNVLAYKVKGGPKFTLTFDKDILAVISQDKASTERLKKRTDSIPEDFDRWLDIISPTEAPSTSRNASQIQKPSKPSKSTSKKISKKKPR